jgi:hypothetical protein
MPPGASNRNHSGTHKRCMVSFAHNQVCAFGWSLRTRVANRSSVDHSLPDGAGGPRLTVPTKLGAPCLALETWVPNPFMGTEAACSVTDFAARNAPFVPESYVTRIASVSDGWVVALELISGHAGAVASTDSPECPASILFARVGKGDCWASRLGRVAHV